MIKRITLALIIPMKANLLLILTISSLLSFVHIFIRTSVSPEIPINIFNKSISFTILLFECLNLTLPSYFRF